MNDPRTGRDKRARIGIRFWMIGGALGLVLAGARIVRPFV
jgi:hypothetical protein